MGSPGEERVYKLATSTMENFAVCLVLVLLAVVKSFSTKSAITHLKTTSLAYDDKWNRDREILSVAM